jgi:D-xylose transport system substrate-binding protein
MNNESHRRSSTATAVLFLSTAVTLASCASDNARATSQLTTSVSTSTPRATNVTTTAALGGTSSTAHATATSGDCVVGVSWNGYDVGERWKRWDGPAMKAAIEGGGGTYISNDAQGSAAAQASNVDELISQGADVVVIIAKDAAAIEPTIAKAISRAVPVIAYDVLIDDPHVLYLSFDNVAVGRLQADAVRKAAPKGRYLIIKGDKADANSDLVRRGYDEIIGEGVKSGDVQIVGESYTDYWDPESAQMETARFLTAANNDVQAVLSENDGMADGVVAALEAGGLAGKVAVSGQDGEQAALNRVALGTQTVSVWKDSRQLAKAAGAAALQLCKDHDITKLAGTAAFSSPGGNSITSVLLEPVAITKDRLGLVLDAGWIDKSALCRGVSAGAVAACN